MKSSFDLPSLPTWMRFAAGAALTLGVAACGGGGGGSTPPAPADPVVTTLTCKANESVTTAAGRLFNNTWNSAAVGTKPWTQCLRQSVQAGVTDIGWNWDWPTDATGVLAYPGLVIGSKPWEDGSAGNDARFPVAVASVASLRLRYTLQTQSTGMNNLSTSMWLINTPKVATPFDQNAITTEVMVWTRASGGDWVAGRQPIATVTIGGRAWTVYGVPQQSDASGASSHRWKLLVYAVSEATDTLDVDLRLLLQDGIDRGWVSATDYLADVELGNEIAGGSGETWVRQFSLDLSLK